MTSMINEVLTASRTSSVRGFATNEPGLVLLRSGAQYIDSACMILREKVVPVACGIEVPSALITRFPGLDYVLQYLIKEGLQNNPLEVGKLISEFTASLLAETFNVAARLNSSAMLGKEVLIASQQIVDLAETKLQDSNRHLREAALRFRRSISTFSPIPDSPPSTPRG